MATITVLLAALNEEETIGTVIRKIPVEELRDRGYSTDIIVVDGHSEDKTQEIAKEKGARLLIQKGFGKGDAVKLGFKKFQGDFLFMLDADNTYSPNYILEFLPYLEQNKYDVLLGSRMNGNIEDGAMSMVNYLGNRFLSKSANMFFPNGHKVTDVCTGFWGFQAYVPKELRLESDDFQIEAEMYSKCIKAGFRVGEFPIDYAKRDGKAKLSSMSDGGKIFYRLVKERLDQASPVGEIVK